MPPQGHSETSPQALAASGAPAAGAARVADDLGRSGSKDALARIDAAMAEIKALAIAPMIRHAINAIRADDHKTATEWSLKALAQDEENGLGWYLLAIARERASDFPSSIQAYETALRLLPDHAEVANDLGRLAYRLGMHEQSEKLFRHFLANHPTHSEALNNLACAVRAQQRYDEAVAILQPVLLASPENAQLWNTMGSILAEQGDWTTARLFFEEALRLNPEFVKARYNLGNTLLMQGESEAALECCDAAMAMVRLEDERQMMRMARSTILACLGRAGEAWDEYEARLDPHFSEHTRFLVDRPRWQPGVELSGKRLLAFGEQGLGDEILFANTLGDVIDDLGPDGRLILAVQPRLVELFKRTFPEAQVCAHITGAYGHRPGRALPADFDASGVDLWTPMGSLLRTYRRDLADYPAAPRRLAARPDNTAIWREQLAALPGRKVGILWKSNIGLHSRHRFFSGFEAWRPVLTQPGVTFVNLQYGDCEHELALAKAEFGVDVWRPPGVDLKQELDEVAALCSAVDLVIGFSNATFNIAAACGTPAWLISNPGAWPRLGLRDRYAWYPQVQVFGLEQFGDWAPVMNEVGAALGAFAAS